ncbi:MAG TPA: GlxA family transcriptional regulator [Polyangiaceae bacterium]|jgi:transcriptional regulator GlxA family with amidase domain
MTKRIAMLAYPDVQILDVTGPLEVFARASRYLQEHHGARDEAYVVEILGLERGPFRTSSGMHLHAERAFHEVRRGIDTLLVAGGRGGPRYFREADVLQWLRQQAGVVRRLGSVCTGAFFLAEAGLLDGCRATTHWESCDELARRFPAVQVESDRLYVREGSVFTAAGVTAGIDLALALVEDDLGRDVALGVARALVVFLRRPSGQAQFSAQLSQQLAEREPLRDLQAYIVDHPQADLSVEVLARRVGMSPRNFARVFTREVGTTPARFVSAVRVETARRLLEESVDDVEAVCARSGLGSAESMRRAFVRAVGVAPSVYRARFHPRGSLEGARA